MSRCLWLCAIVLSFCVAGRLPAADLAAHPGHHAPCCSVSAPVGCPDDYCPKPLPCIRCPRPGVCPDDYCPKPLPCIRCPLPGVCPDDYCPKPLPNPCRPMNTSFYRCVPTNPAR